MKKGVFDWGGEGFMSLFDRSLEMIRARLPRVFLFFSLFEKKNLPKSDGQARYIREKKKLNSFHSIPLHRLIKLLGLFRVR